MAALRPLSAGALALLLLALAAGVSYGSPDPLGQSGGHRSPRFIPSSGRFPFSNLLQNRASFLSTGSLMSPSSNDLRPKRALFDDSCKGVYDRELFAKLDRVCEDCYNLYRKTSVSYECRRNCFQSTVYRECVISLMLPLHKYTNYAHRLYTKLHKKHHLVYTPYTTNSVRDINWYKHGTQDGKNISKKSRGNSVDHIVKII